MIYYYRVYGIYLKSEIKFLELDEIDHNDMASVSVILGNMPYNILSEKKKGTTVIMGMKTTWLNIKDTGMFLIENGKQILVEKCDNCDENSLRAMILGTCMGIILMQNNIMAMHGSALTKNGKTIILSGYSGSGKSSLALEMINAGWKLLADDTVALDINEQKVIGKPGYPYQKLCRDAVERYGINIDELEYINEDRDKFGRHLNEEFCNDDMKINTIFIVSPTVRDNVTIVEKNGTEKINLLLKMLYMREFYDKIGLSKEDLLKCIKISNLIDIYVIERPKDGYTTKEQMKLVEDRSFYVSDMGKS